MIVVANRIYVAAGQEESFEERFRGRAHLAQDAPGFVGYELLRPLRKGEPYVLMTRWSDEASFLSFHKSGALREAHKHGAPAHLFSRKNSIEMHEVMSD